MREIRTIILRLFVHDDLPTLRGVLRAVVEDEEHLFSDEQTLLALLYRLSKANGDPSIHTKSTPKPAEGNPLHEAILEE